jgi:hypothetical protein
MIGIFILGSHHMVIGMAVIIIMDIGLGITIITAHIIMNAVGMNNTAGQGMVMDIILNRSITHNMFNLNIIQHHSTPRLSNTLHHNNTLVLHMLAMVVMLAVVGMVAVATEADIVKR